jgi:hypothetical protein
MLAPESQSCDLDLLDRELYLAPAVTALLFRKVTESGACKRLPSLRQMGKTITLDRVIEAGAWTDAAITLIGFELPNWNVFPSTPRNSRSSPLEIQPVRTYSITCWNDGMS